MSAMAIPSTPNRKPTFSHPRTPIRPRIERTPMTEESPDIVTPLTPSPHRAMRVGGQELEFQHRVARRLFFTPQHGSQSHIPPSPPLTPTMAPPMLDIQSQLVAPLDVLHVHPYGQASPSVNFATSPSTFELGSPVAFQRKNKKLKSHH